MTPFKSMRRQHNLTLKQLREQTGLSISFLSDLERGRSEASMETLRKLAECYGVSPAFFLPNAVKRTSVPSFHVCHFVVFACLKCGVSLEIKRYGEHCVSSSDHCPNCGAYYVANWENSIEQSALMLVESEQAS